MDNSQSVLNLLSLSLRKVFHSTELDYDSLQEIRLRSGQPLILIYKGHEYLVEEGGGLIQSNGPCKRDNNRSDNNRSDSNRSENGRNDSNRSGNNRSQTKRGYIVTSREINEVMEYVSRYSMYAFEEEIKQGYITVPGGHRVGICGKAILEAGGIKTIRCISFVNIRIAHEIKNCSDNLMKYIYRDESSVYNTLIISPPMHGKTTLLRDIIRNISNGFCEKGKDMRGLSVGLTDERSEIAASYMGVPQNDVGMRTDVLDAMPKTHGIMMLIRTMSPKVIAVDEIGSERDSEAILYGIHCGCSFIGTIHGESLEDIRNKKSMARLMDNRIFARYVVLNNKEGAVRLAEIFDEDYRRTGQEVV